MKTPDCRSGLRWKICLWIFFAVILAVFAFGAAVDVDFVDPSVSLSEAWRSASWHRSWHTFLNHDYRIIWLLAIQAMAVCTFHRSPWFRLVAMAIGLIAPVLVINPAMFGVAFISPVMVIAALAGEMDGEFYQEGMMMVAACGLWMLLCFVAGLREIRLLTRHLRPRLIWKSPAN